LFTFAYSIDDDDDDEAEAEEEKIALWRRVIDNKIVRVYNILNQGHHRCSVLLYDLHA
jgi:hypothetical protein